MIVMNIIFIIGCSVVSFAAIQLYNRENNTRATDKPNKPGNDVIMFFFLLIIFTVLSYWLNNAGTEPGYANIRSAKHGGDPDIERFMIQSIKQDVDVGLSPF